MDVAVTRVAEGHHGKAGLSPEFVDLGYQIWHPASGDHDILVDLVRRQFEQRR